MLIALKFKRKFGKFKSLSYYKNARYGIQKKLKGKK